MASFFVYGLFLISIVDTTPSPTIAHWSTWIVALILELVLFGSSLALYTHKHREPSAMDPEGGEIHKGVTNWEAVEILINVIRVLLLSALILFYLLFTVLQNARQRRAKRAESDETTALLHGSQVENGTANGHVYGTTTDEILKDQPEAWSRPTKFPSKTWWEYLRGYSLFFPYLWPAKSLRLQVIAVFCFVLVSSGRIVNILIPIQVSRITNSLSGEEGDILIVPWGGIALYILYRLLHGTTGVIANLRAALWIPIGQYSYQELSTAAFEHVHGLSLDFHLGKKTGEVLSALSKGSSINTFLENLTFSVVPMLVDLILAIGYFLIKFDAYYALVIAIVTFSYIYLTIRLAQWRAEIRRDMVNAGRQEDAVK